MSNTQNISKINDNSEYNTNNILYNNLPSIDTNTDNTNIITDIIDTNTNTDTNNTNETDKDTNKNTDTNNTDDDSDDSDDDSDDSDDDNINSCFSFTENSNLFVISANGQPKFYVQDEKTAIENMWNVAKLLSVESFCSGYRTSFVKFSPTEIHIIGTYRFFLLSYDRILYRITYSKIKECIN
jgi:hypothetical protein